MVQQTAAVWVCTSVQSLMINDEKLLSIYILKGIMTWMCSHNHSDIFTDLQIFKW